MRQVAAIETQLNDFLLRDVVFLLNNGKTLKKGKLILFKLNGWTFISFIISSSLASVPV